MAQKKVLISQLVFWCQSSSCQSSKAILWDA